MYMGLCFDFGAVLEGYPDIFFALNGDVIDHRQPVGIPELRQRLPAPQLLQVGFDLVPSVLAPSTTSWSCLWKRG